GINPLFAFTHLVQAVFSKKSLRVELLGDLWILTFEIQDKFLSFKITPQSGALASMMTQVLCGDPKTYKFLSFKKGTSL
ncbi:hypothetical protein, partial [Paenibacillus sp. S150]|uniref:hypothetical protein n=1 Tax=Paenibacillus sp. S150 TaxID=2749826 RepID=UPI001C5681BB